MHYFLIAEMEAIHLLTVHLLFPLLRGYLLVLFSNFQAFCLELLSDDDLSVDTFLVAFSYSLLVFL